MRARISALSFDRIDTTPHAARNGRPHTNFDPCSKTESCPIDQALRLDAACRLMAAACSMEHSLILAEPAAFIAAPSMRAARSLCEQARSLAQAIEFEAGETESLLRAASRTISSLEAFFASNAPGQSLCDTSCASEVAYSRYGSAAVAEQEAAYCSMLGFEQQPLRLLLTSSGMSAYALIEAFLLREVLRSEDRIVLHPGIYFETREQISSLRHVQVHEAADWSADGVLAAIDAHDPAVVFVDPLSNTAGLRMIDIGALLRAANAHCRRETWFVIDGTMLSGACNPFAELERLPNIRVLYYESACKYLQFGMDLSMCGVVVADQAQHARLERLRRNLGIAAPEHAALPRTTRAIYLAHLQRLSISAGAAAAAVMAAAQASNAAIAASHPTLASHPDAAVAADAIHSGGVLTLEFRDAQLNQQRALEAFIARVTAEAQQRRLALTAGVSFGFRTPRLCAAWALAEDAPAFLRLSAGISPRHAAAIGGLIAATAGEFALDWSRR